MHGPPPIYNLAALAITPDASKHDRCQPQAQPGPGARCLSTQERTAQEVKAGHLRAMSGMAGSFAAAPAAV